MPPPPTDLIIVLNTVVLVATLSTDPCNSPLLAFSFIIIPFLLGMHPGICAWGKCYERQSQNASEQQTWNHWLVLLEMTLIYESCAKRRLL